MNRYQKNELLPLSLCNHSMPPTVIPAEAEIYYLMDPRMREDDKYYNWEIISLPLALEGNLDYTKA